MRVIARRTITRTSAILRRSNSMPMTWLKTPRGINMYLFSVLPVVSGCFPLDRQRNHHIVVVLKNAIMAL